MLQNCSVFKVAEVFFNEPTRTHYLIEISKKSRLAHTSAKQHLRTLKDLSIIEETSERKGKRIFPIYKANLESKEYKFYKNVYNRIVIVKSGFVEFLKDKLMPNVIVLFGSYSKGEDIEESDVDIFVGCKKEDIELIRFEKKINRKIQLHFNENFKSYSKELKNNIINGFVLHGYLEAF